MHSSLRVLLLSVLLPSLALASPSAERMQTIRHLALSASSNLLVYYNPRQADRDPRYLERYLGDLRQLKQLVALEQDASLSEVTTAMEQLISELQSQPASNAYLYPTWINPVLQAQARLDQEVANRYAAVQPENPVRLELDRLNLNIQRLHLLYQTRTFGSLAVYLLPVDEQTFPELDQEILRGFREIERLGVVQGAELDKLKRNYDFIRPRLLQHDQSWVPGSAAYYLGQVGDGLERLSKAQALSDQ